ncbi:MAG: biotin/lipoyl-containing protein [Gemmatimonadota bacterium]
MSGASSSTWFVTPEDGAEYRVVVEAVGDGWSAIVERGEQQWTFTFRPGPGDGLVWIGERLRRWAWNDGRLSLDGSGHPFQVETEARRRVREVRAAGSTGHRASELRAPMPGLVVAVLVQEGELVEAGQGMVVIEAMKMENDIVAPASGIVRGVAAEPGDAVERDALLCRIEPVGRD